MRGTKAKALRKLVFGDFSHRDRGSFEAVERRRKYRRIKKALTYA